MICEKKFFKGNTNLAVVLTCSLRAVMLNDITAVPPSSDQQSPKMRDGTQVRRAQLCSRKKNLLVVCECGHSQTTNEISKSDFSLAKNCNKCFTLLWFACKS